MAATQGVRRVRLTHRASEVAVLDLSAAVVGIKLSVKAAERVPMPVTAQSHPMDLFTREVV